MLVLTRRDGQTFKIGEDVVITVLESHTGITKIGIEAPKEVRIERQDRKGRS